MRYDMNQARFLDDPQRYFAGSYDGFRLFGGPSVYFHTECLLAGRAEFLSARHIEMIYATLTSWGMHRMGDPKKVTAKLTDWDRFHGSIVHQRSALERFRNHRILEMSEDEYASALRSLKPCYEALRVSVTGATIVANSKTLFHIFPEFVPPIDRQYTIRFFTKSPDQWLTTKGRFRAVSLPAGLDAQFGMFCRTCLAMKALAAQVNSEFFEIERQQHGVTPPKAMDNAIVNYVRTVAEQLEAPVVETPNKFHIATSEESAVEATVDRQSFLLTVGDTYYRQGFFNVPVAYGRFFGGDRDGIDIRCQGLEIRINGHINRTANKNVTPRIMGGTTLRNWFQGSVGIGNRVRVEVYSPTSIYLKTL